LLIEIEKTKIFKIYKHFKKFKLVDNTNKLAKKKLGARISHKPPLGSDVRLRLV
jgi:hypothetical protein